ncbi:MAG: DUF3419 family protein [Chthoniobacterales bacterium]
MELGSIAPATAWEAGRFDARGGAHKLLFGCMHEDAAIELRAFPSGGRVFCIASAGCTAIALAAQHEVVAVDINPMQLAYVGRRLAGGPIERGSAECMLAFARNFAPLIGWRRETLRRFLELDQPNEQLRYWRRHLDTRRFRLALDLLFARSTLRPIYSASLLQSLPPNFGTVMRRRMERGFGLHSNRCNPYARMLLLGEMCTTAETDSAARIQLVCSDAAAFLERQAAASFNGFSLSNILDGASDAYEERLLAAVRHAAAPGALIVLRSFREPSVALATNRAAEDRSMLWGIVDVRAATAR